MIKMIRSKLLIGLIVLLVFVGATNVVMAKDNKMLQEKLLGDVDTIRAYLNQVEIESKEEGVLHIEVEADLVQKKRWLSDERLRIVSTEDGDQLKQESRRMLKFWLKLKLQLKALKLKIVTRKIEIVLEKLRKIQIDNGLDRRASLVNKLEIASDKLETVKISLDSLVFGEGEESDWLRDKRLLDEVVKYEKYALSELRRELVSK